MHNHYRQVVKKIGLIAKPKKSLENAGFAVDIFKSEAKMLELEEVRKSSML